MINNNNNIVVAYKPQTLLEKAIHGQVWKAQLLKPHSKHYFTNEITLWEATNSYVAIKEVTGNMIIPRCQGNVTGRHLQEDPLKEIAALQLSDGIISDDSEVSGVRLSHVMNAGGMTGGEGERRGENNMRYNVMSIKEVLHVSESFYIVMPHCPEKDLSYMCTKMENGMAEPLARHFFRNILKALRYLRTKGICHRDISPENIVLDGDQCYLTDFGLSLRVPYGRHPLMWPRQGDGTSSAVVTSTVLEDGGWKPLLIKPQIPCGKPNCIAPEIASCDSFDGYGIDLWAAGSILYKMLTGNYPYRYVFRSNNIEEFQWATILDNAIQRLHKKNHISSDAKHLLSSMLMVDPGERLTLEQVMNHPWVQHPDVIGPSAIWS